MGRIKFQRFRGVRKRKKSTKINAERVTPEAVTILEAPVAVLPTSACSKKYSMFDIQLENLMEMKKQAKEKVSDDECCNLIVNKLSLSKFFAGLCCPLCHNKEIAFDVEKGKEMGFASCAFTYCKSCETVLQKGYLSERVGGSASSKTPFEVNWRSVFAFTSIGAGYNAIKDWASMMNLPNSPNKESFQSAKQHLSTGSEKVFEEISKKSVENIFQKYAEEGIMPDNDGILDIAVSYDGSWQRRGGGGHSSHNGIGAAIDILTGLPVDYEVLCNFCHQCLKSPSYEDPDYGRWQEKHKLKCSKNYDGSANSMEQECAIRIWERSVEKHNLRYTTMLSDGDSKSFDYIVERKVYGNNIEIKKEECVNHVSKRMGTALINLTQECKSQKESISGKGKLTKEKIVKIQNYYGRAIKDNAGDIPTMKKCIFAILFHLSSSDKNPKHVHCPDGEQSWCFWKRAIAKKEKPAIHKDHETIPESVGRKLVPIFQRLTDEDLLKRCSRNTTQNPNESLHGMVWRYCPKITFVGRKTIEIATRMALCQFSMGATFRSMLLRFIGVNPGIYMELGSLQTSLNRIKKSEKASLSKAKNRRKQLKYSKYSKDKKKAAKEGTTYKAGSFD